MDIQITEQSELRLQTTPWALAVAAGAGLTRYLVCRTLFKQTRAAALLQAYIALTSAFGAFSAATKRAHQEQVCVEEGTVVEAITIRNAGGSDPQSTNGRAPGEPKPKVRKGAS